MLRGPMCRRALEILLPAGPCVLCGEDSGSGPAPGICRACWRERRRPRTPLCSVCGTPFPTGGSLEGDLPCGECLRDPPAYEEQRSAYLYEGPVREMLLLFKEGHRYPLARLLGGALARAVRSAWPDLTFECATPVPGGISGRMRRGFEPADLIGRVAARKLHIPFVRSLGLTRATRPQKRLTAHQRRENLRGAFRVRRDELRGKRVLLVDDVTTTGATLREASRILRRAGAEVWAATVALTPERALDLQRLGDAGNLSQG